MSASDFDLRQFRHDARTPLTALFGFAEYLEGLAEDGKIAASGREHLAGLVGAVTALREAGGPLLRATPGELDAGGARRLAADLRPILTRVHLAATSWGRVLDASDTRRLGRPLDHLATSSRRMNDVLDTLPPARG